MFIIREIGSSSSSLIQFLNSLLLLLIIILGISILLLLLEEECYGTDLIYTITHCSMLFPTVGWPMTSTQAANLAYLYTLPLCTFFPSLYYNVVIQSTSLQCCDNNLRIDFPVLELKFNFNYYAYNCLLQYIPDCN